eukprot:TRINITY_DN27699_c0_g2_i1.p1 TRINITY_DN27699_c0_g2~~TRINITY_DN27699_c0_g2_i1.p1  ORF type:complete len:608 (+),score=83.72 TRINITY_DN27699_c0_g2_i1:100-1923(+)
MAALAKDDHLDSREKWESKMGKPAEELEKTLWDAGCKYDDCNCGICERRFTDHLAAHITSKKHLSSLWYKLESGGNLEQSFELPSGEIYTFNHLSGECTKEPTPSATSTTSNKSSSEAPAQSTRDQSNGCTGTSPSACASDSHGRCSECGQDRPWASFPKKQRWLKTPQCSDCYHKPELLECRRCSSKLERSKFNKKIDWEDPTAPTCTECLFEEEKRAQREHYASSIAIRCEMLGAKHAPSPVAERLWSRCQSWGERLAQLIDDEMKKPGSRLAEMRYWSEEAPSREHASDKDAADKFKCLEDKGDELVYKFSEEFFQQFVARETLEKVSVCTLQDKLTLTESGRSWKLDDNVVLSVRPFEDGWPEHMIEDMLKAEPRSQGVMASTDFAQFDYEFPSLLESFQGDTTFEVKLVPASFWASIEDHRYQGDNDGDSKGSHNQILSAYFGSIGGAGQQANRTENMNLFGDLLGFHDSDSHHDLQRQIWAEHFGHMFPERLSVTYGAGQEFQADKQWKSKKEANVAEALIGALNLAGLENYAHAAVVLCFLCSIARPRSVVPSNQDMAKRVLGLEDESEDAYNNGDTDFVLDHISVEGLRSEMDREWLAR